MLDKEVSEEWRIKTQAQTLELRTDATYLDQRGDRWRIFLQRVDLKVCRDELVSHGQFELAVKVRTRPFLKQRYSGQREEILFYPTRLFVIHLKGRSGDGLLFVLRAIPLFCLVGLAFEGLGHHRHSRGESGGVILHSDTQQAQ